MSKVSVISKEKLQELIEGVPDVDDPDVLSYWQKANDEEVYLEGWADLCLAGTGFPSMEEGGTAQKVAYIRDLTPEILQRKAKERGLKLIEGGFKETPDAENLYGVTYGIYGSANREIPKTYVTSLGTELELPVAMAVEALVEERTASSGFHEKLNQRWTIVFWDIVKPKVAMAAKKAGLEVSFREIHKGSGNYLTDISLPNVGKEEIEKATAVFNRFAELYEANPGEVRKMENPTGSTFKKEFDLAKGDRVKITIPTASGSFPAGWGEGKVLSAHFYGERDGWYIELEKDKVSLGWQTGYGYWKQGEDGGYVEKLVGEGEHHSISGGTEVYVEKLPKCDFCGELAHYDGKTVMGPWGYMCEKHFKQYGVGLGTGKGQKLIPRKALEEAERIRAPEVEEKTVTMTESDLEAAALEDIWYPVCPYCGAETPAEPDAHAVYCQACNRRFKIYNPFFSSGNPRRGGVDIRVKAIAEEAAVKAAELTGSKIAQQVARELSGEMLHQSPVSEHCEAVLETPPECYNFRGIRSWVLCRAWQKMEEEKLTRLPVGEAWSEARKVCRRD